VVLAAVAASSARLKIGTSVTPLPRRRPQVLAHTLATLDILSNGRVVFGAGLGGVPAEYAAFGEPDDPMRLAAMLDEGLEVLSRLWSGDRVLHHGPHYSAEGVTLAPLPIQRPRIPVWIGGESAPALRRAARWDGWIPGGVDEHGRITKTPEQLAAQVAIIRQQRTSAAPLEVAILCQSASTERALARA
jgi:alkanesulfonate monooxygenase SsuD/methylene tetrahydromethanopterin reductase-like flavin-dependent oxidoreductase (luciferase family)